MLNLPRLRVSYLPTSQISKLISVRILQTFSKRCISSPLPSKSLKQLSWTFCRPPANSWKVELDATLAEISAEDDAAPPAGAAAAALADARHRVTDGGIAYGAAENEPSKI